MLYGVSVGVGVGVGVSVKTGIGIVGSGIVIVGVRLGSGRIGVFVGVAVAVGVSVGLGVIVGVAVGVAVGVGVAVAVGVAVGVFVRVAVRLGVRVRVTVVAGDVRLGVGVGTPAIVRVAVGVAVGWGGVPVGVAAVPVGERVAVRVGVTDGPPGGVRVAVGVFTSVGRSKHPWRNSAEATRRSPSGDDRRAARSEARERDLSLTRAFFQGTSQQNICDPRSAICDLRDRATRTGSGRSVDHSKWPACACAPQSGTAFVVAGNRWARHASIPSQIADRRLQMF